MFDPSKFTVPKAKPLPVILLLDISGSMNESKKINTLNKAVLDMLETFSKEERMESEILVSIITFGNEVKLHLPLTNASRIEFSELSANGLTPMGTALRMAKAMIEDKDVVPTRAYRPTLVLVSDGQPTDEWEKPMNDFINEGRSSKCDRFAIAIGDDADAEVLGSFCKGTHPLFYAEHASELHDHFQRITMSVTVRTKSINPNEIPLDSDIKVEAKKVEEDDEDSFF